MGALLASGFRVLLPALVMLIWLVAADGAAAQPVTADLAITKTDGVTTATPAAR